MKTRLIESTLTAMDWVRPLWILLAVPVSRGLKGLRVGTAWVAKPAVGRLENVDASKSP